MKAIKILSEYPTLTSSYVLYPKQYIQEAIAELEELQYKSCESCKYLTDDEYKENCFIVDACIKNDITLPDNFCCNQYEEKFYSIYDKDEE